MKILFVSLVLCFIAHVFSRSLAEENNSLQSFINRKSDIVLHDELSGQVEKRLYRNRRSPGKKGKKGKKGSQTHVYYIYPPYGRK
ncbi:hypothetical protein Trydic_g14882 [Trypoxylus dichotomus]